MHSNVVKPPVPPECKTQTTFVLYSVFIRLCSKRLELIQHANLDVVLSDYLNIKNDAVVAFVRPSPPQQPFLLRDSSSEPLFLASSSSCSSFRPSAATDKVGMIVGAVIGAILLLLLLLLLIWLIICCCHKRRYEKEAANDIR